MADDPSADWISSRDVNTDVASPLAFAQITKLINECVSNHRICRSPCSKLPILVLDVLRNAREDDLKIVASSGREDHYAALSYR